MKNSCRGYETDRLVHKKAPSLFKDGAPSNMQFLHYAWITFPLCIHNVSIACSDHTLSRFYSD